jgi:hypothetical protein
MKTKRKNYCYKKIDYFPFMLTNNKLPYDFTAEDVCAKSVEVMNASSIGILLNKSCTFLLFSICCRHIFTYPSRKNRKKEDFGLTIQYLSPFREYFALPNNVHSIFKM